MGGGGRVYLFPYCHAKGRQPVDFTKVCYLTIVGSNTYYQRNIFSSYCGRFPKFTCTLLDLANFIWSHLSQGSCLLSSENSLSLMSIHGRVLFITMSFNRGMFIKLMSSRYICCFLSPQNIPEENRKLLTDWNCTKIDKAIAIGFQDFFFSLRIKFQKTSVVSEINITLVFFYHILMESLP